MILKILVAPKTTNYVPRNRNSIPLPCKIEGHILCRNDILSSKKCLRLQVRGRHYGNERELIWNNGLGLERDSVILQNATRARVTVDAQGRRTLTMSGL